MTAFHQLREPLPTKEQINALTVRCDLEAIRDEIDRRIARIETDLDYGDGNDEWASRARNALYYHRYMLAVVSRRLKALPSGPFKILAKVNTTRRERTNCDPLTWDLLDGWTLDVDAATTPEAVQAAIGEVDRRIRAIEADRADEAANYIQAVWDLPWLAETKAALAAAKALRGRLDRKAIEFRQAAKRAAQIARDESRAQMFVDAARELLSRETFLMLWDRVDRQTIGQDAERGAA